MSNNHISLTQQEITNQILDLKKELGNDICILSHYYQQDHTFQFGDFSGDSLYLSQQASKTKAKYILFCGVHFMAESADILTSDEQQVILPNASAGCSMADMADIDDLKDAWQYMSSFVPEQNLVPIAYINSSAAVKAFCGEKQGTICTSANANKVVTWALKQGKKVLFLPDQHLGRNTGTFLGVPNEKMPLWKPTEPAPNLSKQEIEQAQIMLWDGYCSVHCRFSIGQIEAAKKMYPQAKIIVHPEVPQEIVQLADDAGSTSKIIDIIEKAPTNSVWFVGTEINLVHRLAKQMKQHNKLVFPLNPSVSVCSTMYRTKPIDLLLALQSIKANNPINVITVPQDIKASAYKALNTMLQL